jgi:hypothetical protein
MGAAEAAIVYAEGYNESTVTMRSVGKRRGSAGARGAGRAGTLSGRWELRAGAAA